MKEAADLSQVVSPTGDGVLLRVKVVPGASRTKVAGVLGDRLKVAIAAPPEGGKANRAVCEMIAELLGVAVRDVEVSDGQTHPRKTLRISGISLCAAVEKIRGVTMK